MTAAKLDSNPGWQARLDLKFSQRDKKTIIAERHQQGPLAIQRPFYPEGTVCHAYVLHPPGGVVGGDQLAINLHLEAHSQAVLTTPGATKFYRSNGKKARQKQNFHINGALEWLPQENIFFPGAHSELITKVHLKDQACYIGWDIQCLGRPVLGESFKTGSVLFHTQIYHNQRPLFIDRLHVNGEDSLKGIAGLRSQPVFATLLATPADKNILDAARAIASENLQYGHMGLTLMNKVLVVRYLGNSTAEVQKHFRNIWQAIRPLMMQRPATYPRIWNT